MLKRIRQSSTLALLLSPVGVLLIAATRLLIVSNYNLNTALAILSSGGYVNTLLGTVIPLVPVLMPYLALLLLYLNRVVASLLAFLAAALISPSAVSGALALSIVRHYWHMVLSGSDSRHTLMILLAIPFTLFLAIELVGLDLKVVIRAAVIVATIALLPVIILVYPVPLSRSFYVNLLSLSKPWLPAERITFTTHQVVIGYALGSDGYWLEVMQADSRNVVYYRMSQISERTICQIGESASMRPLIALIHTQSSTPACGRSVLPKGPTNVPVPIPIHEGRAL